MEFGEICITFEMVEKENFSGNQIKYYNSTNCLQLASLYECSFIRQLAVDYGSTISNVFSFRIMGFQYLLCFIQTCSLILDQNGSSHNGAYLNQK